MEFVNERIHRIPQSELSILEHRLSLSATTDVRSSYGIRKVHCLYFDRAYESTAFETRNNLIQKNEYRISYEGQDLSTLRLGKKCAANGMSRTESCEISRELVEMILYGTYSDIVRDCQGRTGEDLDPLLQEFYWEVIGRGLRPKVLVDYETKSFAYSQGNAQVTINHNPGVSYHIRDFLDPWHKTTAIRNNQAVVHVKWDHFLPDVVRTAFLMVGMNGHSYHSLYQVM